MIERSTVHCSNTCESHAPGQSFAPGKMAEMRQAQTSQHHRKVVVRPLFLLILQQHLLKKRKGHNTSYHLWDSKIRSITVVIITGAGSRNRYRHHLQLKAEAVGIVSWTVKLSPLQFAHIQTSPFQSHLSHCFAPTFAFNSTLLSFCEGLIQASLLPTVPTPVFVTSPHLRIGDLERTLKCSKDVSKPRPTARSRATAVSAWRTWARSSGARPNGGNGFNKAAWGQSWDQTSKTYLEIGWRLRVCWYTDTCVFM